MKRFHKNSRKKSQARNLHISRLFPNMVTLLGLCAGLSAVRYALLERWEHAVIFLVIAAFIDGIDGRLARLLKSTSVFGAHLDSLSDFINFGLSPALVIYLWKTEEVRGFGWAVVVFFVICCALRLARFNTNMSKADKPDWSDKFFVGVPAPAGALLAIIPLMISFWLRDQHLEDMVDDILIFDPKFICLYMTLTGILMASRIPTYSIKKASVPSEYIFLALIAGGLYVVLLIVEPWLIIPLSGILYLLSIPFSVAGFYKVKRTRMVNHKTSTALNN